MRVLLVLLGSLLTVGAAIVLDPDPSAVSAITLCFVLGVIAQAWAHELGHVLAGLLVGGRVVEVSILARPNGEGIRVGPLRVRLGLRGSVSRVVAIGLGNRGMRRIFFALGGPLGNFAFADGLLLIMLWLRNTSALDPALWRSLVVVLVIPTVALGVANLIPMSSSNGHHSDGRRILDQLRPPQQSVAQPAAPPDSELLDIHQLRWCVDNRVDGYPELALQLTAASAKAGQLPTDLPRLMAVAGSPSVEPHTASLLSATHSWLQGTRLLLDTLKATQQTDADPALVAPIAEAAEFAFAREPENGKARVALALVRFLQLRPADARTLLAAMSTDGATPLILGDALAVQLLAEMELGDFAQAHRLVDTGAGLTTASPFLRLISQLVPAAEEHARGSVVAPH